SARLIRSIAGAPAFSLTCRAFRHSPSAAAWYASFLGCHMRPARLPENNYGPRHSRTRTDSAGRPGAACRDHARPQQWPTVLAWFTSFHARLRVRPAPGIPCAFGRDEVPAKPGRKSCRGNALFLPLFKDRITSPSKPSGLEYARAPLVYARLG